MRRTDGGYFGEQSDCAKIVDAAKRNVGCEVHATLNTDGSFTLIVPARDISQLCGIVPGNDYPLTFCSD